MVINIRAMFAGFHPEPIKWLETFQSHIEEFESGTMGPTDLLNALVQLGICSDPKDDYVEHADCSSCRRASGEAGKPVLCDFCQTNVWMRDNFRTYNRAVWQIIEALPGLRAKLRRALRDDLKSESKTIGPEYGRIALKSYARELLKHFLIKSPDGTFV